MAIIREHAGLSDAWVDSHESNPVSSASPGQLRAEDAISLFGVTADSPLNSYSAGKPLDATARQHFGKRLDYILYRQPIAVSDTVDKPLLKCRQSRVVFTDRVSGLPFSFSDHFGLEATIDIVRRPENDRSLSQLHSQSSQSQLSDAVIASVIRALTDCYRVSSERSRYELSIFVACVMSLIALCIGSAWVPRSWINPIYLLITVFISWLGTTMLYAGFIYGNWERRALTNVTEELELVRQSKTQYGSTDRTSFELGATGLGL